MNRKDFTPPCPEPTHFHDYFAELFRCIDHFSAMGTNAVGVCDDRVISYAFQQIERIVKHGIDASNTLGASEKSQKSPYADEKGSGQNG